VARDDLRISFSTLDAKGHVKLMKAKHYDFILSGGGAAGLSLAFYLNERWPQRSLLIVDEEVKRHNDHTWCFWSPHTSPYDSIAYRTWSKLAVIGKNTHLTFDISPYHYRMIRSIDFYRFVRQQLGGHPNVDFMLGTVERVVDGPEWAEVLVNEITYRGDWVFDSRYRPSEYRPHSRAYHYLTQHFLGWEIETATPRFDTDIPHLFDFRTAQPDALGFLYVLPFSQTRGLVEYTLFSAKVLPLKAYETGLKTYIEEVLGTIDYQIVDVERGIIPMTDHPQRRRAGDRIMNTGTRGGRVKASSGYAFSRIQRDARAVVASLQKHGHPFDVPKPPRRYEVFDATMLHVLERHGERGARVFLDLFSKNPIERIFRFLDEEGSRWENVQLMATVPRWLFVRAGMQALWRRWLPINGPAS
jgi:lycopene beta-cyclase